MQKLKTLNRGVRFFSSAQLKSRWKNLSFYLTNENDSLCWKELNAKVAEAEKVVELNGEDTIDEVKKIEWDKWMNKIGNTQVLSCMKNFYDSQMKILDQMEQVERKDDKGIGIGSGSGSGSGSRQMGGDGEVSLLFDKAVKNCKSAEEESERLLVNGAKALWIQFHNPQVQDVDNNEWIESDLYWKAFVEKHALYNLNNKSLEPEDEENKNALKNEWHKKTTTFNERSDTPILYDYMINLPSWEYYDINRRVFLEHMCYFLLRTGLKFQMFPELFKWKWMTHIEDLRFHFLDIAVKRKNYVQLETGKREVPLELQPVDYEHHGEEFHLKLLQHFRDFQNLVLSRLMANFIFLCDPYIPIQTKQSLETVQKKYKGKLYKLNNETTSGNCLFYLPTEVEQIKKEKDQSFLHSSFQPFDALYNFYCYLKQNNIQLNPTYSQLLHIVTEVLQERGDYWLKTPNETIADAFLRRYNKDDSLFPTFVDYVNQMKEQFDKKIEIPLNKYKEEIKIVEQNYEEESKFFAKLVKALLNDEPFVHQQVDKLQELAKMEKQKIQNLIDSGEVHIIDEESKQKIHQADQLLEHLQKQEMEKMEIQNFIKTLPN